MGKINSVHDNFIRAIMADKSIAAAYFQNFLPSFVSEKLDFDTLTQLSDTYVSGSLHKTISDIVYSCRIKETDDGVKVCLLIEHKSAPDRSTPIQMGSYIFSGMQKQVDNKEELSLIIPILLYHGKNKWKYETVNGLFKNLDPDWKIFLPDFDYVYNNLGELSQRKVEALNNKFLSASLLALKYAFRNELLGRFAKHLFTLTESAPENLQRKFIVYFFQRAKLDKFTINELIESISSPLKEAIMSTADIFRTEGKKEGIEQGIQRGMERGIQHGIERGIQIGRKEKLDKSILNMLARGIPTDTICEVLEVNPEYVAQIQNGMTSQ